MGYLTIKLSMHVKAIASCQEQAVPRCHHTNAVSTAVTATAGPVVNVISV